MAVEWEVTDQTQAMQLGRNGRFVESMEVSFQTIPEGINGSVTVPMNQYTADYVRDLIDSRVTAIKRVQGL